MKNKCNKKKLTVQEVMDKYGEDIVCYFCYEEVIDKNKSRVFICEGSWCEEACERFINEKTNEDD